MTGLWRRRLRDNGICIALLVLLPLAVHLPPWLNGMVAQDVGVLMELPPWKAHGVARDAVDAPLSAWQLRTSWPAYQFISTHRHELSGLQWNPMQSLGIPFLANPENRVLSPFSIFFYLFEFNLALLMSLLAKAIAAGCIAYYVARRYGFTPWYGLLVALIFQWSGPIFIWGMEPVSDSLIALPLLLLATDRLILGQFKSWPGVALVVGFMAVCGDIRIVASSVAIMGTYIILRRLRDHRRAHIVGGGPGFVLGVMAGLGLAAVQLLPYVELLREGNAVDHGYPWPVDGSLLLGIFGPSYHHSATGAFNPLVHVVYVGVIPLLFIGLWISLRRLIERPIRHRVESLLIATLLVAAVPLVLQELLPTIDGLRFLRPVHYLAGLSLPLALMVAGAVESWLHLNADQCKRALYRMAITLPITWGGLLAAFLYFSRDSAGQWTLHAPTFWVFTLSVGALILLFGTTMFHPKARVLVAGTLVLVVLTTAWGTLPWQPQSQRADMFPRTGVIQALQESDARVGGTARMASWPLAGNQIPALYAPGTVVLNRTQAFLNQVDGNPLLHRRASVGTLLLQKEDIEGAYAPVREDLNIVDVFDTGLVLFRDNGALPRFRIAHAVESDAQAAANLRPGSLPVVPDIVLPPVNGTIQDTIRLAEVPRNDALDLEVETSHPGILIVAEAWYPGWKAEVNGNPVPVLPVDGALRGVELRAGTHTVTFRYQSTTLRWGTLISLLFLVFFLAGAYWASRRPKRRY